MHTIKNKTTHVQFSGHFNQTGQVMLSFAVICH
uniref:Uncharacterized protein n=1 Tax=Anguilla anguilla TaxID=7936 RepID=A0A0E9UW56_ANGAN